jgi:hypothetical protein
MKAEFDDDVASTAPSLPATEAPGAAISELLHRLPPISTFEVMLHVPLHNPALPAFRVLGQASSFVDALQIATDAAVKFHSKSGRRSIKFVDLPFCLHFDFSFMYAKVDHDGRCAPSGTVRLCDSEEAWGCV